MQQKNSILQFKRVLIIFYGTQKHYFAIQDSSTTGNTLSKFLQDKDAVRVHDQVKKITSHLLQERRQFDS